METRSRHLSEPRLSERGLKMDLGTIQIDNLDQECVAGEHILKLVQEHIKTNAEADAAIDKLFSETTNQFICSYDGAIRMAEVAGIMTDELRQYAENNRAKAQRV